MSKTEIVKPTGASTNEIYQLEFLKVIVWNRFAKTAISGAFRRAFHRSVNKKISEIEIVLSS